MALSKIQRVTLFSMFDGRCAYCGQELPIKGWHADHIEPIYRGWKNGSCRHPDKDIQANYFPACRSCNLDKSVMPLEMWRQALSQRVNVCRARESSFRSAEKFGLVQVIEKPIVFHFEINATLKERSHDPKPL